MAGGRQRPPSAGSQDTRERDFCCSPPPRTPGSREAGPAGPGGSSGSRRLLWGLGPGAVSARRTRGARCPAGCGSAGCGPALPRHRTSPALSLRPRQPASSGASVRSAAWVPRPRGRARPRGPAPSGPGALSPQEETRLTQRKASGWREAWGVWPSEGQPGAGGGPCLPWFLGSSRVPRLSHPQTLLLQLASEGLRDGNPALTAAQNGAGPMPVLPQPPLPRPQHLLLALWFSGGKPWTKVRTCRLQVRGR